MRYIAIAYVSFFVACIVVTTPLGEFVIVNKNHKHFFQFLETYKKAYVNKPKEITKW